MDTQPTTVTTPSRTGRAIGLRIAGADLLLSGRFEHWVPTVLADGQGDEAAAQLLVDVTSALASGRGRAAEPELLSFSATHVEAVAPQSYRAKGTLRAHGISRPAEALLHSPAGHTPFLIVTLSVDRTRFADLWAELEGRACGAAALGDGDAKMRPRGWLRIPELAAA